ncbi:MAG TPA: MBOAT family O-acyltransferase [Symbiobacteriaceae bacterium]|jgi:alginate O-acetyltransferase complex protein AlgI
MLFHSPEFMALMLLTLLLYAAVPKARTAVLAVANAVFYGMSGFSYLLLFMAVLSFTHLCAVGTRGRAPKLWLTLGIIANLANLFTFKYTGFAATNLDRLLHLGIDPAKWQLILPVGISFYTFHLIAYLVDVYRGVIPPARNLLECWVFTAFFGQLIAGPIMRGEQFLPQIINAPQQELRWEQFKYGVFLFVLGMGKKVLLADNLSPRTENFFASWTTLNGLEAWIAGWLFAFQVYYDFSAYSEMALGIGHMFGLELAINFRTPYLAANPSEFWKRWHITLSTWIRDYLYIPLGGSRKGNFRAYANLVAAMALSGLWHGAAWTFVAWGLFHGGLSALHKLWTVHVVERLERGWRYSRTARWVSVFLMFQATTVGWIFFRAPSIHPALTLLGRMLNPALWHLTPLAARYLPVMAALYLLHVAEFWVRERESAIYALWTRLVPSPVRALAYTAVGALLLVMTELEQVNFIYFRF